MKRLLLPLLLVVAAPSFAVAHAESMPCISVLDDIACA